MLSHQQSDGSHHQHCHHGSYSSITCSLKLIFGYTRTTWFQTSSQLWSKHRSWGEVRMTAHDKHRRVAPMYSGKTEVNNQKWKTLQWLESEKMVVVVRGQLSQPQGASLEEFPRHGWICATSQHSCHKTARPPPTRKNQPHPPKAINA